MKDFKKSKFFIVFVIFMTLVYFYDADIYNELKAALFTSNVEEEVLEPVSQGGNLVESDDLLSPLRVYFLDVGQADSILIQFDDEYMLIDAGNNEDGEGLVSYLKSMNIEEFKYVVGTHAHEDHIGGMDDVIDNFKIDNFLMPDVITTTRTFEDVLDSLDNKSIYFDTPNIGDRFNLGDSVLEVIYIGNEKDDINNTSIVLRLVYNDVSFLFMGDAESGAEEVILNDDVEVSSTVLKVGHHGSKTGTTLKFLKEVNPKYAVISSGYGNSYGHPHDVILNRLNNRDIKVYRTDKLGTVIVSSNGLDISFSNIETSIDGN